MTEYHARYGGAGVMIYWHVERKSVCIYSQLKTCSASEVAALLKGLLRQDTTAEIDRNYTDTHGASIVGFAFCNLLGFRLLPRLKRIGAARLYRRGLAVVGPSGTLGARGSWWRRWRWGELVGGGEGRRLAFVWGDGAVRRLGRGW